MRVECVMRGLLATLSIERERKPVGVDELETLLNACHGVPRNLNGTTQLCRLKVYLYTLPPRRHIE